MKSIASKKANLLLGKQNNFWSPSSDVIYEKCHFSRYNTTTSGHPAHCTVSKNDKFGPKTEKIGLKMSKIGPKIGKFGLKMRQKVPFLDTVHCHNKTY